MLSFQNATFCTSYTPDSGPDDLARARTQAGSLLSKKLIVRRRGAPQVQALGPPAPGWGCPPVSGRPTLKSPPPHLQALRRLRLPLFYDGAAWTVPAGALTHLLITLPFWTAELWTGSAWLGANSVALAVSALFVLTSGAFIELVSATRSKARRRRRRDCCLLAASLPATRGWGPSCASRCHLGAASLQLTARHRWPPPAGRAHGQRRSARRHHGRRPRGGGPGRRGRERAPGLRRWRRRRPRLAGLLRLRRAWLQPRLLRCGAPRGRTPGRALRAARPQPVLRLDAWPRRRADSARRRPRGGRRG
jgi:hypothetical protein